jgi:serine/threonine-protein kinase
MADPGPLIEDLSGTVIDGRYQILQRESQGGMGAIYKARHVALDVFVAIKVMLKPRNLQEQERFLQEAQLASKIRHPNTVYLSDFGILPDGQPYLVMEFLSGRTLNQELAQAPMEPPRACKIGAQIARGLQAVHDKGIVHRDLKPANIILLEQDGTKDFVKIVDFGLARSDEVGSDLAEKPAATSSKPADSSQQGRPRRRNQQYGFVVGSPSYMPPEQAAAIEVDYRADQYALGCVLYEMLCGEPPFVDADPMALLFKHINEQPPPLRQRAPKQAIAESLDALVMRLLAKSPAERFATMREVELALQSESDRLEPPSPVPRAQPSRVGWRGILKRAAPALVLGVIALGAVGLGYRRWGSRDAAELRPGELREMQERAMQVLQAEFLGGVGLLAAPGKWRR